MTSELQSYLAETQKKMDELVERLGLLEDESNQSQTALSSIELRLSKLEKKLNDIASIKIYKNIIQKDLKTLSKEAKATQRELLKIAKKTRKNTRELKALAKLLRLLLHKYGIYLGKKASLKKICSSLACYPWVSPRLDKKEEIIEL